MKLFKVFSWILLLVFWAYKIYTNDLVEKGNTMYYVAIVVSIAGLVKSIYDYRNSIKEK